MSSNVYAGWVLSTGETYVTRKEGQFSFTFPQDPKFNINQLIYSSNTLNTYYENVYGFQLDEKTDIVFSSSNDQTANGFATMYPNSLSVFYGGGASIFDSFSMTNWLMTLLIHETSHLYQLNAKGKVSQVGKSIFGNNPINFIPVPIAFSPFSTFPFPIITSPNVVLPTWILEGNAVFNESRFGFGGRLYSGEFRAIFLKLLKEGILNETRITNNQFDFPYTREKYILGAFFNMLLAKKVGIKKLNQFFKFHGNYFLNPLRVNNSFLHYFGFDYSTFVNDAIIYFNKLAQNQKNEEGTVVAKSQYFDRLNSNKNGIYFLTNESGVEKPTFNFYLNFKKWYKKSINLPRGKIFFINNKPYSAATGLVDRKKNLFGLWGENLKEYPGYQNYFVQDKKENIELAIEMRQSFERPQLFLNKKKYAESYSTAILSKKGVPIYFDQTGKKRILMMGKQALLSYQGFYGYPVDSDKLGNIYFVGPTQYGSGLYKVRKGQVSRLGVSDLVIDARKMNNNKFLIVEIDSDGYKYKEVSLMSHNKVPFEYTYFFESIKSYKILQNKVVKQNNDFDENYHSFSRMRFSRWNLIYGDLGSGSQTYINGSFADPLGQSSLDIVANIDNETKEDQFSISYLNTKNLFQYGNFLSYQGERNIFSKLDQKYYKTYSVGLQWSYHFMRYDDIDFFGNGWASLKKNNDQSFTQYYLGLVLRRSYQTGLGLFPYYYYSFFAEGLKAPNEIKLLASIIYSKDFGKNIFLETEMIYSQSSGKELEVGSFLNEQQNLIPVSTFTDTSSTGNISGAKLGLNFKKVIKSSLYHRWIPLGLRRIGLSIFGNALKSYSENDLSQLQYGASLDGEVLLAHLTSSKIKLSWLKKNTDTDQNEFQVSFSGLW